MAISKEQRSLMPPSPREVLGGFPAIPTPRDLFPTPKEAIPSQGEVLEGVKQVAISAVPPPKNIARGVLDVAGLNYKEQMTTAAEVVMPVAVVGGAIVVGAAILVAALLAPK